MTETNLQEVKPQQSSHDAAPLSIEEQLMQAAAAGDAEEVSRLIELEADVDYQDEEGVSPLMKAAEGGHTAVLTALLQAGAPWNAQDKHGYCAGEYAMGSGQQEAVDLLLDFAVQAELVLGALHRRMQVGAPAAPNSDYLSQKLVYKDEQLLDADGEAVMMGWERPLMLRHAEAICPGASAAACLDAAAAAAVREPEEVEAAVEKAEAVGLVAAVLPPAPTAEAAGSGPGGGDGAAGGDSGLAAESHAQLPTDQQEEGQQGGQQQQQQQQRHAAEGMLSANLTLAEQQPQQQPEQQQQQGQAEPVAGPRGRVLNIGFGLGIVDTAIQAHHPERHTIVEAHPDVYDHMVRQGWAARPGVRILRGRWQDVLAELLEEAPYDGIFFDTYGEYYEEMREFHTHLPKLLAATGVYSFFNGLASDNIFFHMVYCRLISLELAAKGFTTEYEPVPVGSLGDEVWQGVRSKYWHFETYFLPRVTHETALSEVAEDEAAEDEAAEEPEDVKATEVKAAEVKAAEVTAAAEPETDEGAGAGKKQDGEGQ